MLCLYPLELKDGTIVPCGRCMPCRINRVRSWTIRILMEYQTFKQKGLFVTLTYDDEHLPQNGTLVKSDLQKFLKRLRRDLEPRKIKYYACGEYGENGTHRPHYHLIILGVDNNDAECIRENWPFCNWRYMQKSSIGTVTADSIQYVAGYVQKKIYGREAPETYEEKGLLPPFQLQSKGLGLKYCSEHLDDFINIKGIPYKGHIAPFPRYFKEKFENRFPETFFSDMADEISVKDYKETHEKFLEGWKKGYRKDRLKEYISESKMTERNYKIKYLMTKGESNL